MGHNIAALVSIAAGLAGLAFAILAFVFFVIERLEAKPVRSLLQMEKKPPEMANTSIGDDAQGLAELAKALKDTSRSLQAAFIAVLFFLIAAGGGIGVAATDAAQTAADNGPPTTTICTQGCQGGG